jgi:ribosomal protein RSM22 (predicted rRNA methylase)
MKCPYIILLEGVSGLLQTNIDIAQEGTPNFIEHCEQCSTTSDNIDIFLAGLKDEVKKLWEAYRSYPVTIDYSKRYVRAAYMLSYFPYYIEPIYYILNQINNGRVLFQNKSEINVGFLGGGALPELVGLVKYISHNENEIQKINAIVFDITPHWISERESCTMALIDEYLNHDLDVKSIIVNLWDENFLIDDSIKKLDLIVLQNSINEASEDRKQIFRDNLSKIWNDIPNGAIFVIIDLNYRAVSNFISNFINSLKEKRIIKRMSNDRIESGLPKCDFIQRKLFDFNESGLYPRSGTREYLSVILQKKGK